MGQVVVATFVDGVFKPDEELQLKPGTKVRLVIDTWQEAREGYEEGCAELDRLCVEFPVDSGRRLTRNELHERH